MNQEYYDFKKKHFMRYANGLSKIVFNDKIFPKSNDDDGVLTVISSFIKTDESSISHVENKLDLFDSHSVIKMLNIFKNIEQGDAMLVISGVDVKSMIDLFNLNSINTSSKFQLISSSDHQICFMVKDISVASECLFPFITQDRFATIYHQRGITLVADGEDFYDRVGRYTLQDMVIFGDAFQVTVADAQLAYVMMLICDKDNISESSVLEKLETPFIQSMIEFNSNNKQDTSIDDIEREIGYFTIDDIKRLWPSEEVDAWRYSVLMLKMIEEINQKRRNEKNDRYSEDSISKTHPIKKNRMYRRHTQ